MESQWKAIAWNTFYFLTTGAGCLLIVAMLTLCFWLGAIECTNPESAWW